MYEEEEDIIVLTSLNMLISFAVSAATRASHASVTDICGVDSS